MSNDSIVTTKGEILFPDPPLAHFLFGTTRLAWLWLILRLLLGYSWLTAGLGKLGNPAWTETGEALKGFWTYAVQVPEQGSPPIAYDWYRAFINFMLVNEWYVWFAKLVTYGEIVIGIALILGAFTGIAAFLGGFMNWNFIMAGSASSNALLFAVAILLMLAWKAAGWYGLDRWLLPRIGAPWTWTGRADIPTVAETPAPEAAAPLPQAPLPQAPLPATQPVPAAVPAARPAAVARTAEDGAVQMLTILQRQGRLVDFLQENLAAYEDAQIGAAVRNIHEGCRQALAEHVTLAPVYAEAEGSRVTVDPGFDAQAVRLTGQVTGNPPFRGVLRHRGWQVSQVKLPEQMQAAGAQRIVAAAEVEVNA